MINPTRFDLGRKVIYTGNPLSSEKPKGTLESFNEDFAFVRYAGADQVKATSRADLEWASKKGDQ